MRKKKSKAGRPSKYCPEIVEKLKEIFKIDWTIEEACSYAWIDKVTYYSRCEKKPWFFNEMEKAKKYPLIIAKKVLIKSMWSKNEQISLKAWIEFLSRRDSRYSNKNTEIQKPYEKEDDEVEREWIKELINKRYRDE